MLAIYGERKYLTLKERVRFENASMRFDEETYLFCRFLNDTGCRISEALNMTIRQIDFDEHYVYIESLKKRRSGVYRRVPLSPDTVELFSNFYVHEISQLQSKGDSRLWTWSRMTAYRRIRKVMELAGIRGTQASPKGLRHGFAVAALEAGVPMNLVQRWLGHAHWQTTAIYADLVGGEERAFAERLWTREPAQTPHFSNRPHPHARTSTVA